MYDVTTSSWFVGIIGGVLVLAALLLQSLFDPFDLIGFQLTSFTVTILIMLRRDHAAILSRTPVCPRKTLA